MRLLDLFSGTGGFSLGLERAGFETVAFCEIDPTCHHVLRNHWPKVPIYDDVQSLDAARLAADRIAVDAICGGFPCQDISLAGSGQGLSGERSGLWRDYARLVGQLRPRYVFVENSAALLGRGLGDILGFLAAIGYDAQWHCIPAAAVGAPHLRDRVWIVAYSYTDSERCAIQRQLQHAGQPCAPRHESDGLGARGWRPGTAAAVPGGERLAFGRGLYRRIAGALAAASARDTWAVEPAVGRVVDGYAGRVDAIRQLGNAVVPQIPEAIGRAVLAAEQERVSAHRWAA